MHGPADSSEQLEASVVRGRLVDAALSLQCKATLLVAMLLLTVMAAVSGYLLRSSAKLARGHQDEEIVHLAGMLAKAAGATLASEDVDALETLGRKAANGSPLLYVAFSDIEGRILAKSEYRDIEILSRLTGEVADGPPALGIPTFLGRSENRPALLDIMYPISVSHEEEEASAGLPRTRLLGYVRMGMHANRWYEALSSKFDLIIGVSILAITVAIPLGFLLIRRIVFPLEGLALVMGKFSEGQLDIRCPVGRRDEIGRLAEAFNRMADQHQRTHEGVVRLNAELEERVNRRTMQLRDLASREPLTGLYNRRHFSEVLGRSFAEAARYETELSCIMLDLDDFKSVNDEFGHQVGDEVLVLTARTITAQLRSSDVAARFGGDEFIILLPQTGPEQARVLGERIMEQYIRQAAPRVQNRRLTMSMGIASVLSLNSPGPEPLVQAADRALYQAKTAGKSCIIVAEPASRAAPL